MNMNFLISSLLGSALLLACVERPLGGGATGDSSSTSRGETSGVPTSSGEPGSTGPQPGTTTTGSTGSETTCGFICATTTDGPPEQLCDTFQQNCPEGEKCVPYAEGPGNSWNATKCVPVTGDGQPGEPCTAVDGGVSGLDDCAKGIYCWDVDRMGDGRCVAMCIGSADAPVCKDENINCAITSEGVLNVCIPGCDPLIQDCFDDDLCIPVGDTFVCVLDGSGDEGQVFDACEFANACDKGLLCLNTSAAEECDPEAFGCCMPFCDLTKPDVVCPGVGQSCVSLYEAGMAPPDFENVGICVIPG